MGRYLMPSMLDEDIQPFRGLQRQFLLLRIAGLSRADAFAAGSIKENTYDGWLCEPAFKALYRKVDTYSSEYQKQAIVLLRRSNQLKAVLLENKILDKMEDELKTGKYHIIKTEMGKMVYTRLLNDMDFQPQSETKITWEQRISNIVMQKENQDRITTVTDAIEIVEPEEPLKISTTEEPIEEMSDGDPAEVGASTSEQPEAD
jgi:hypothetical protein